MNNGTETFVEKVKLQVTEYVKICTCKKNSAVNTDISCS